MNFNDTKANICDINIKYGIPTLKP